MIFTEWSENIMFALPDERYDVTFEKTGDTGRIITVEKRN
jgi:tRNA A37 threonylcarbamoyladenosine biosynthesis protein TsaE